MLFHKRVEAFNDPAYLFELKLDGVRCIAYLDENGTELRTKENRPLLSRFPEMSEIHRGIKKRCILDGELFVMRDGRPDFEAIQPRIVLSKKQRIEDAACRAPASFVAFDILYAGDKMVTSVPLIDRKNLLSAVAADTERMAVSRFVLKHGIDLFNLTKNEGLEGVVAKRADSLYYPGKAVSTWLKIKNFVDKEFIICGFIRKPDGMTSIIVAQPGAHGELLYKGHVTLGVRGEMFKQIRELPTLPSPSLPVPAGNEKAIWVVPKLIGLVQYLEQTSGGSMRHAVLKDIKR